MMTSFRVTAVIGGILNIASIYLCDEHTARFVGCLGWLSWCVLFAFHQCDDGRLQVEDEK